MVLAGRSLRASTVEYALLCICSEKTEYVLENILCKVIGTEIVKTIYIAFINWILLFYTIQQCTLGIVPNLLKFCIQVKLLCPIEGSPPPIIEWNKGEEMVDYQMTRYRTNKKSLKIRNVNIEDSGRYVQFICNVLI